MLVSLRFLLRSRRGPSSCESTVVHCPLFLSKKTAWLSGGIDEDCNVGGCTMISSPVNYIELKFIAKKRCVIYLETLHPLVPNAIPVNYIKY